MRNMIRPAGLLLALFAIAAVPVVGIASVAATTPAPTAASQGMPVFVKDIAPDAMPAVAVVDAFAAAIKAMKLEEAKALLDPAVLILESGGSERSRDEYMAEHAVADAAFMQNATQELRYRQAHASGDLAWVATESLLRGTDDGKPLALRSTETVVLRRTEAGWRIVHIHWSSRRVQGG